MMSALVSRVLPNSYRFWGVKSSKYRMEPPDTSRANTQPLSGGADPSGSGSVDSTDPDNSDNSENSDKWKREFPCCGPGDRGRPRAVLGGLATGARPVLLGAVPLGHAEGQVQRLRTVQPRVAGGLVPQVEVVGQHLVPAPHAFGDVLTGQFDVDAARMGAQFAVHLEEAHDLVEDVVEPPGLVTARGRKGVAVHRVAHPHDLRPLGFGLLDQAGQPVTDQLRAHPGDEGEPAGCPLRIEPVQQ